MTIIIIAHRLTTLKECDSIVRFNSDHTISVGSYESIVNNNYQL
jgi:ABC-type multidrug transport system fused ATPase/permease subunit